MKSFVGQSRGTPLRSSSIEALAKMDRLTLALKLQRRRTGCKARNKNKNGEGIWNLMVWSFIDGGPSTASSCSISSFAEASEDDAG